MPTFTFDINSEDLHLKTKTRHDWGRVVMEKDLKNRQFAFVRTVYAPCTLAVN